MKWNEIWNHLVLSVESQWKSNNMMQALIFETEKKNKTFNVIFFWDDSFLLNMHICIINVLVDILHCFCCYVVSRGDYIMHIQLIWMQYIQCKKVTTFKQSSNKRLMIGRFEVWSLKFNCLVTTHLIVRFFVCVRLNCCCCYFSASG